MISIHATGMQNQRLKYKVTHFARMMPQHSFIM